VKIGIVVPFSWSFWGAVVELRELQAASARGSWPRRAWSWATIHAAQFTRALHLASGATGIRRRT
jgi:hypothetical protein